MRIGSDSVISCRCQCLQFRNQSALFIKEFFRFITFEPVCQNLHMFFRFIHHDRNLMCAEAAFDRKTIYNFWTGPALWRTQNDHRPHRTRRIPCFTCMLLDCPDLFDYGVHGFSHGTVHGHRIVAFYKIRLPAAAFQELLQFFMRNTGKNSRICNFVSIQMENRKYCAVCDRVQKFIGLPGSSKRAGFCFSVTNRNGCNQIRIIKYSTKSMSDTISKLTAFVDGTWCFRCAVTGNTARERKLFEHFLHTVFIFTDVWIYFAVASFQICIGNIEITAVSGTGQQDHVKVIALDDTVQM